MPETEKLGGDGPERMELVNQHPNGPTDPEEMDKLASRYAYDKENGTFQITVGDPA